MINKRILYINNGNLSILIPAPEALETMSIEDIAKKDVPNGVPYKIVTVNDLPTDREFRDAWEADMSNPDGFGIGSDAWFQEQ
jgi:hypothetical protein